LKADGVSKDMTCKDANDGEITLTVSGGCTPYTITWSDGQAANNNKRQNLAAGSYKVTVADAQGQSIDTLKFTITNPTEIIISNTVTNGTLSSIALTVTGGSGTYTYSWTGPGGFTSNLKDISGLAKGDYTIKVKDSRGCEKSDVINVTGIIDPITFDVKTDNTSYNGFGVSCKGECNGKVTWTVNANEPYVITLDGKPITSFPSNLCAGTHILFIKDAANKTVEAPFNITEPPALTVEEDEVICENSGKADGSITVKVTGGVPEYTYNWSGSNSSTALADDLVKGNYTVTVTDKNKCTATSKEIKIAYCDRSECYKGSIIVTPNNDGFNDFFTIKCSDDLSDTFLHIYNRLGNEVFNQANYDGTWNGLNSDGAELPEDGYLWVFVGKNELGVKEVFKGSVTLLRD
jgi:gliding motility-associated-like protein